MLYIVFQERISYLEQLQLRRRTDIHTGTNTQTHTKVNSYINSQIYTYYTMDVAWFEIHYNNPIDHGRCRGLNFLKTKKTNSIVKKSWQWTSIGMTWSHRKILIRTIYNLLRDGSTDVYRFLRMPYPVLTCFRL